MPGVGDLLASCHQNQKRLAQNSCYISCYTSGSHCTKCSYFAKTQHHIYFEHIQKFYFTFNEKNLYQNLGSILSGFKNLSKIIHAPMDLGRLITYKHKETRSRTSTRPNWVFLIFPFDKVHDN
ncbi:MAG: hypothetical protein CM15mP22_8340 [Gammaproteobacteria bacterium]|nr:MAG: hypothetical protein CM15mP22_8340 [Gammaproteobacteria bacterium]